MKQPELFPLREKPTLQLTVEETITFSNCPYSDTYASEGNYPGYNDIIRKIHEFADDNRNR